MAKYNFTFAGNVRAYACVTIEAEDDDAAWQRAKHIAASWGRVEMAPEMKDVVFEVEYDTLDDVEPLEDFDVDERI